VPSYIFGGCILLRVKQWLHAHIVETVWLKQVNDIEPIFDILSGISNGEEIPLSMSIGIKISSKYQIILELAP
jgi:hypothetical protein